jgi:hypothetical protein
LDTALHDAGPDPITLIALRGEHQITARVDHR